MVYRILRGMEELKWVTSAWEGEQTQGPPRRIYRLSALGFEVLSQWIKDLERSRSWIERFLYKYQQHIREDEGAHREKAPRFRAHLTQGGASCREEIAQDPGDLGQ
jgi:DNA-binding PadR family transcriptional regulator